MDIASCYQNRQNAYTSAAAAAYRARGSGKNASEETSNIAVDGDNVEISPEAKELSEKQKYEEKIRGYYSDVPGSLDEVRSELEAMKEQYSDHIADKKAEQGIGGMLSFGKFTAFDGTTPPVHRGGFLAMVSKAQMTESVDKDGNKTVLLEDIEYVSNKKNYGKFIQSIDNDMFGKIAAYSTLLNLAEKDSGFASLFEQNPSAAIDSNMEAIINKIGYMKMEGNTSNIQYVFTDERK